MEETKDREFEIRLGDLWTVFKKSWWILLLVGVLVCGCLYGFLRATHVNQYTATATIYINRPSGTLQASQVSISNALIGDYLKLVTMETTLNSVLQSLGFEQADLSNTKLKKMISVSNDEDTRWIEVSVTAEDPDDAVDLVNALAEESVEAFNNDLLGGEKYSKYYNKVNLEEPWRSVVIANPISLTKVFLVGLVACILTYLVFFIIYITDDKINTSEDIEKYLDVSLLGEIPHRHGTGKGKKYYGKKYSTNEIRSKGESA